MYTDEKREAIRLQVVDYLGRNRISPSSLAVLMKLSPYTLRSFLDSSIKPQFATLKVIERWLKEYDHIDFIQKKKELK